MPVGYATLSIIPSLGRGGLSGITGQLNREAGGVGASTGKTMGGGILSGAMAPLGSLAKMTGLVGFGMMAKDAIGAGISTAAGMETAQIGFTTMLGSAQKAQRFMSDLANFAAKTPFDLPGLTRSAQSLVSIGIQTKDVIPIMTTLGNVTSGMGTGAEGIQRATIALQQMNAAQKINGQDLAQLRDAGIPVYDLLSAAMKKPKDEIAALAQKGKLGKDALDAMMNALKSGDGLERFSGLMDKQSTSLSGLWSTVKDTFGMGMAQALGPLIPLIKDGLAGAIKIAAPLMQGLATGIKWVIDAATGLWNALKGPFSQIKEVVANALGLDEATPFIDLLGRIQNAAMGLWQFFSGVFSTVGGIVANALQLDEATPFADLLWRIQTVATGLWTFFTGIWSQVGTAIASALNLDEATPFLDLLGRIQGVVMGSVVPALQAFASWIMNNVVPAIAGIYQAIAGFLSVAIPIVAQFVSGMMARLEPLMPKVQAIFSTIGQIITAALALVKAVIERVTSVIKFVWDHWGQQIMDTCRNVFSRLVSIVQPALNIILGIIRTVTALIQGNWSGAWNNIKSVLSNVWGLIKAIVSAAIAVVKSVISGALSVIQSVWSAAWNGLKSLVSTVFGKIGDAVKSGIDTVVGFVRGLGGKVLGAIGNLGSTLWSAGSSIIQGFLDGLKAKWNDVTGFVSGIGTWIKDHKGPLSYDATLLVPAGKAIMGGLDKSLRAGMPSIGDTLADVTQMLTVGVPSPQAIGIGARGNGGTGGLSARLDKDDIAALVAALIAAAKMVAAAETDPITELLTGLPGDAAQGVAL